MLKLEFNKFQLWHIEIINSYNFRTDSVRDFV